MCEAPTTWNDRYNRLWDLLFSLVKQTVTETMNDNNTTTITTTHHHQPKNIYNIIHLGHNIHFIVLTTKSDSNNQQSVCNIYKTNKLNFMRIFGTIIMVHFCMFYTITKIRSRTKYLNKKEHTQKKHHRQQASIYKYRQFE